MTRATRGLVLRFSRGEGTAEKPTQVLRRVPIRPMEYPCHDIGVGQAQYVGAKRVTKPSASGQR